MGLRGREEAWVESLLGGFFLLTFQQQSGSPGLSPQVRVAVRGCAPFLWSRSYQPQSLSGSRVWRVLLLAVLVALLKVTLGHLGPRSYQPWLEPGSRVSEDDWAPVRMPVSGGNSSEEGVPGLR